MENQLIAKNEDFQMVQLFERCLDNWKWFVVSGVLCLGLACIYIKSTPKQYKRIATVLIKEQQDKDITAAFSEYNPLRSMANVNNEIEAIKSLQLMQEVARRLKLDVNYFTKDGLRNIDLYSQSPIIAEFYESEYFSFQVELLPDSAIVLSNFVKNKDKSKRKQKIETRFGEDIETPFGDIIKITPSLYYFYDPNYKPIKVSKGDIKSVALKLSKAVKVSLSNKLNTVLSLDIEDVSIQRAEDVLNTLIAVYQENWVVEKNKATETTISFLKDRIAATEQELMDIDSRVALFKSRNLVVSNAASMQMNQSMQYSVRIQEFNDQISIAKFIQSYLNDNTKLFELLPTTAGVNNPALESQISNYNTLLNERNRLVANSSALNPVIIERNKSLESLRQSIIQTVDNLISSLNLQLSGLQSEEARMTRNIASNPNQERYLISVEREQDIKETLYKYLLQQREENTMALIVTATNSQIISPPAGSNDPVRPNKIQIILIAIIVGCCIPFGVILAYDIFDPRTRDKRDLAVLSVPLLGIIPEVKEKMVQEYGIGRINESFRILRTNLRFACSKDTKVIQITSMEPNAGKTFIALNLAMSIAFTGKKIALLDMDLRRATLTEHINKLKYGMAIAEQKDNNELKGIAAILKNIAEDNKIKSKDIADMWVKMSQDMNPVINYAMSSEEVNKMNPVNFDVILANTKPPNPAELLMGDGLARIIEVLKETYDYIFIDSPPIHPVVDTILIAEHVDISLFVVREKVTDRRKLPDIENIFKGEKFKNMHLILNGSTADVKTNRYNAYYYDNNDKNIFKSVIESAKKVVIGLYKNNKEKSSGKTTATVIPMTTETTEVTPTTKATATKIPKAVVAATKKNDIENNNTTAKGNRQ